MPSTVIWQYLFIIFIILIRCTNTSCCGKLHTGVLLLEEHPLLELNKFSAFLVNHWCDVPGKIARATYARGNCKRTKGMEELAIECAHLLLLLRTSLPRDKENRIQEVDNSLWRNKCWAKTGDLEGKKKYRMIIFKKQINRWGAAHTRAYMH